MKKSSIDEPFIWEISREEEMKIREQMRVNMAKKEGETNKANAIAKNMLEKGYSIKEISEITNLNTEDVEKLK